MSDEVSKSNPRSPDRGGSLAASVANYRQSVSAVIASFFAVYLYTDVLSWVVSQWARPDYSHGPAVVAFSVFLLWSRREKFAVTAGSSKKNDGLLLGILLVAAGLTLRLTGIYTAILTLEALSFIPFLGGLLLITSGYIAGRWAAAPVAYLVFMIPLPGNLSGSMSATLQSIATNICVVALQICGVPATADGNIIHLSESTIGVAEACSGIRMLYAFVAVSVAACLIGQRSKIENAVLLISSVPIAVIANCIRIWLTGLAYEYFDASMTSHLLHDFWGLAMLPLAVALVYGEMRLMKAILIPSDVPREQKTAHAT